MSRLCGFPGRFVAMDVPTAPSPTPASTPLRTPRSAQVALGVLLVVTLGLLAFRGYGNGVGAHPTEATPSQIDLNQADRAALQQVPGIGPALAKKIEEHRRERGLFKSVDELRQVKGVGAATFDKVRPFLRVDPENGAAAEPTIPEPIVLQRKPPAPAPYPRQAGVRKLQAGDPPINVNTASMEQLMQLPAVGAVTAQNIIAARTEKPFRTLADLDRVKNIGAKTLEKLRPFVVFD